MKTSYHLSYKQNEAFRFQFCFVRSSARPFIHSFVCLNGVAFLYQHWYSKWLIWYAICIERNLSGNMNEKSVCNLWNGEQRAYIYRIAVSEQKHSYILSEQQIVANTGKLTQMNFNWYEWLRWYVIASVQNATKMQNASTFYCTFYISFHFSKCAPVQIIRSNVRNLKTDSPGFSAWHGDALDFLLAMRESIR